MKKSSVTILFSLFICMLGCTPYPTYQFQPILEPEVIVEPYKPGPLVSSGNVIVVDAGHGGKDLGAHSLTAPRYQEKLLTLSTARLVKKYLEQFGHTVLMTRTEDVFIPLEQRAAFANKNAANLFVSIHYNSAENKEAQGIEIFYFRSKENEKRSKNSKLLAQAILEQILESTGAKSRGVKAGDLSVIRNTTMPAVLVEGGFLTHAEERQKVKSADYLKQLAWGIAQGINDFLVK